MLETEESVFVLLEFPHAIHVLKFSELQLVPNPVADQSFKENTESGTDIGRLIPEPVLGGLTPIRTYCVLDRASAATLFNVFGVWRPGHEV